MKKALVIIIAIIFFIGGCVPWVYSIVKDIQFGANCRSYLKLAADANTIDVAEKHLSTAIEYIEKNNLDEGYTKIFVYRPTNDFGIWYENLKSAQTQLQDMQQRDYTDLEESNMLMKLRETLMDEGSGITHPDGAAMKENYTLMFWLNMLLWIPCWVIGIILCFVADDMY